VSSENLLETLVRRETIYTGKTLNVHKDIVTLPNGREAFREIVEHRGSVVIVACNEDVVYFVRQYRHATGEILLELAAGTMGANEDPADCAARETAEELGLSPARLTLLCEGYVSPGYTSELQRFFLAQDLSPATAECDDDEFIDVVQMPWHDALAALDRGEFRDSKTILGLLTAVRRLGIR
jgi:ADP-ribose pyrophosphatase